MNNTARVGGPQTKMMAVAISSTIVQKDREWKWRSIPMRVRVRFPRKENSLLREMEKDEQTLKYLKGTRLEGFVRLPSRVNVARTIGVEDCGV